MTATQQKSMQSPTSPLNVKEQLEATATRFWTSVTKGNDGGIVADVGAIKVPGVPVGLFSKRSDSNDDEEGQKNPTCNQHNSLQFIVTSMFSSCTTGANAFENDSSHDGKSVPSLLKHASRSTTVALTPSSSRGETSAPAAPITPSPLHQKPAAMAVKAAIHESSKTLFKNNHEIAQEAIHRLRQQHQLDRSERLVTNSLNESEGAVDVDRDFSVMSKTAPSMFSANPSTLSMNPSTLSNNRTILSSLQEAGQTLSKQQQLQSRKSSSLQKLMANRSNKKNAKIPAAKLPAGKSSTQKRQDHSFFPASKPKETKGKITREERRMRDKLRRNKGVPKEVTPTSPIRMLPNRNTQRQKQILNSSNNRLAKELTSGENQDADESWDIENDGISDITQSTVDRMVLAISQHLRVFPEEADNLNRIHSDVTDPAPKRGSMSQNNHNSNNNVNVSMSSEQPILFPMVGGDVAGFTPPRGGSPSKGMSPGLFTRNIGSVGTRSFFTKTTNSTQTNDFANAWRIDEQKFWDSEVAKESQANLFKDSSHDFKSPSRMTGVKKQKQPKSVTTSHSTLTTLTQPQTLTSFASPHSPPSHRFQHRKHEERTSEEVLFLQNQVETAEI